MDSRHEVDHFCEWCDGDKSTVELVGKYPSADVADRVETICICESYCGTSWCKHHYCEWCDGTIFTAHVLYGDAYKSLCTCDGPCGIDHCYREA